MGKKRLQELDATWVAPEIELISVKENTLGISLAGSDDFLLDS